MRLLSQQPLWLLFIGSSPAFAAFEEFFFAGNAGNNTAIRKCGNMPYACNPPSMCSQDTLTRKWYCCGPGVSDAVCWNGAPKCEGDGTNVPSESQTGCTGGTTKYCCLKDAETCTKVTNQFNICWSNLDNPLRPLNATRLNETFSSLSSARPAASSYTIDKAQLLAQTSTTATPTASTSTPASASASASAPASATSGLSQTSPRSDGGGVSGGAIAGIVVGVVGGLALLAAAGFFLWRRKRSNGKTNPYAPATAPYQGYGYQAGYQPQQGPYSPQPPVAQMDAPLPTDKYAHTHPQQPVEAPAFSNPVEMDASYHQQSPGPK